MSQERRLAFLQNFYTDVTLYVPSAEAAQPAPANAAAALVAPAISAPQPAPGASLLPAAAPGATPKPVELPAAPIAAPLSAAPTAPVAAGAASLPPPPGPAAPKLPSLASLPATAPPAAAQAALPAPAAASAAASLPPPAPAAAPPPAPAVPPVMLTTFSTLGDNAQGVVLLFRLPAEQFRKLPRNVFLNKLLQALGLVMADVVLVNVESHLPVALSSLRREIGAGRVLAFGRNLLDVAVRTTQIYEPVQFTSLNLSYLAAAEVELLEYDTSLKKRLWTGLQRMFMS
ncbi:hypothetical protein [uncultured Hymenobacter sp.]|uniref:hypothetical protein n=1 Tax=uncultured Hymenobacter sp. TaxID=170016 RepID=UPI0035CBF522